jgi:hypothetical protein
MIGRPDDDGGAFHGRRGGSPKDVRPGLPPVILSLPKDPTRSGPRKCDRTTTAMRSA